MNPTQRWVCLAVRASRRVLLRSRALSLASRTSRRRSFLVDMFAFSSWCPGHHARGSEGSIAQLFLGIKSVSFQSLTRLVC